MSVRILKSYVKKHGMAKTAVVLGYKETGAIRNWIARGVIPEKVKEKIKGIKGKAVIVSSIPFGTKK